MKKQLLFLLSTVVALIADVLAVRALLGAGFWAGHTGMEFILWHGLAMVCAGLALRQWLPESYRQISYTYYALLLGFMLCLPLVGFLFLLSFGYILRLQIVERPESKYIFGERQVLTTPTQAPIKQGARSVLDILSGTDNFVRRKAILALRQVEPKKALPVLQKAIQDSDEQVRLLAQTQFNKTLANLELAIKTMEAALASGPRETDRLIQLSEQYHELVYLGLSSEETQTIYLNRAIELLEEALAALPKNQAVQLMLLKCSIKNNDLTRAQKYLSGLQAQGYRKELLSVWEAEIYYQQRDWQSLNNSLKQMREMALNNPRIQGQIDFWLKPATH